MAARPLEVVKRLRLMELNTQNGYIISLIHLTRSTDAGLWEAQL